jgi:hypothetical protein
MAAFQKASPSYRSHLHRHILAGSIGRTIPLFFSNTPFFGRHSGLCPARSFLTHYRVYILVRCLHYAISSGYPLPLVSRFQVVQPVENCAIHPACCSHSRELFHGLNYP